MKLRTITIGLPLNYESKISDLEPKLKEFLDKTEREYKKNGFEIRTFRINLSPIKESDKERINKQKILGTIDLISKLSEKIGIRWFNVPFDLTSINKKELDEVMETAFEILKRFPKTFINFIVASDDKISYNAITKTSKFIKDASKLDNTGYNNFRVGVSCNVKSNSPFFPFTFSSDEIGFSVGLELPQELIKIITPLNTTNLTIIRKEIINKLTLKIKLIEKISKNLEKNSPLTYHGTDLSIAPYPEKNGSVASILELLGIDQQGSNGTLFITSYLTDILKVLSKEVKTAGFCGVMFSLLEDDFMGRRNNSNNYTIDSLISYAAVCGCGLDMVPLPGDIFEEELSSIILDIAALSTVLNKKPLGVRVLPIPMKQENELTSFDMGFLFNTRIMKIKKLNFLNNDLKKEMFSYYQTVEER